MSKSTLVEAKSIGRYLPEEVAKDIDALYDTLPNECHTFITKAYYPEFQFEPGERAEVSIITAETVDQSNEVVLIKGINLDSYRKHGTVLWNHNRNLPIAHNQWIKHNNDMSQIRAKTIYPTKREDSEVDWFTDHVWSLTSCQPPVIRAKSIGFLPKKPKREATEEELKLHPEWQGAGIWDDALLVEYSCLPMGCNSEALVVAVNNKSIDSVALDKLEMAMPYIPDPEPDWVIKAQADPCVSKKIKWMHDQGEASKYSDKQIVAIAYAHCKAKKAKKKAPDYTPLVEKALADITLDWGEIKRMALELYRNRGKVC